MKSQLLFFVLPNILQVSVGSLIQTSASNCPVEAKLRDMKTKCVKIEMHWDFCSFLPHWRLNFCLNLRLVIDQNLFVMLCKWRGLGNVDNFNHYLNLLLAIKNNSSLYTWNVFVVTVISSTWHNSYNGGPVVEFGDHWT